MKLFQAKAFADSRGFFREVHNSQRHGGLGLTWPFVQDNMSYSVAGVLRGMHLQVPSPQGKLVQVLQGSVFDVAVDLRVGSPTFGEWESYELSAENQRQVYIPEGLAHGFVVLDGPAVMLYKCTALYTPSAELTLRFDDPEVGIEWPAVGELTVSDKDREGLLLRDIPRDRLMEYRENGP